MHVRIVKAIIDDKICLMKLNFLHFLSELVVNFANDLPRYSEIVREITVKLTKSDAPLPFAPKSHQENVDNL